ncbi:cell wall-associated hydrolase [Fimbriimonas ginsengisoli Gsoil 348]|uniref:Cell wall-associated hydrolase n=1 Tax=Fimbriimonas ginsengisoli Gsoil 348 TaxID=661478 RepID=A0A068NVC6_FIMGI|nr:cell wall-associated hydrolase [Fimbriimonas ginsengisoli Gsoil 348]
MLGNVGKANSAASIHTRPNSRSSVYYKVKPDAYLIVRSFRSAAWMQVYMNNGAYGYVESKLVTQLPYEVTGKAPARSTRGYLASRGSRTPLAGEAGASNVADYATQFMGTPYVWGGNDVYRGIDCSGFVKKMYGAIGKELPRTAAEQAMVGEPIYRLENLRKGDRLYFWDKNRAKIGHTGIYLGNGNFVHSSSGKHGVSTDYLGSQKWLRILVAARR